MKLFLSPHNDDETLFGSFTVMRERPEVMVVFDSYLQVSRGSIQCHWASRQLETLAALRELTAGEACPPVTELFARLRDDQNYRHEEIAERILSLVPEAEQVWAPLWEQDGHAQHNAVALAASIAYPGKVTSYLTYTRNGGKSTNGRKVSCNGAMLLRKLKAMACYKTQIEIDALGCWPHFMDLNEYVAE